MSVAGSWSVDGNAHDVETISQSGNNLKVSNVFGFTTTGLEVSYTQVEVNGLASNGTTGWGGSPVYGQLVPIANGQRIVWSNGAYWDQLNLTGGGFINGYQPVTVQQYGTTLLFTNEHGYTVWGSFINNPGQVQAYGWGGPRTPDGAGATA